MNLPRKQHHAGDTERQLYRTSVRSISNRTELHRYLLAIQNALVPGKSALKAVQLRLDQNSSDPIATRQMKVKTLCSPQGSTALGGQAGGSGPRTW